MGALVTLAQAKAFLGLSSSAADTLLELLIPEIEGWIVQENCILLTPSEDITERADGGMDTLYLTKRPVTEVVSVTDLWDDSEIAIEEYRFNPYGVLVDPKNRDIWEKGEARYEVVYSAGYDTGTIPAGLKLPTLELIYRVYNNRDGRSSDSILPQVAVWQSFMDSDLRRRLTAFSLRGMI